MISAWTDIPFSFTVHAHDIFIPELAELMEEKIKRASFIVCISEYNKDYLVRKYPWIKEDKIEVVHCGIDINKFTPRKKIRNKILKILSVGRLHEQKGFEYLIRACELLKKECRLDFTCEIIGDGQKQASLKEMINRAELTQEVRLLGAKAQGGVLNAMEKADVFVLPCVAAASGAMDGIPVVLMEAMSMGLPVISTTISGIPELVKNGAGLLVEPGNVKELASAIEKFAVLDHDKRGEAGKRGRRIIEKGFNLNREVGKLTELFSSSSRKL
jgi:glycosyltransferase involved in cell wall biosynthesis